MREVNDTQRHKCFSSILQDCLLSCALYSLLATACSCFLIVKRSLLSTGRRNHRDVEA